MVSLGLLITGVLITTFVRYVVFTCLDPTGSFKMCFWGTPLFRNTKHTSTCYSWKRGAALATARGSLSRICLACRMLEDTLLGSSACGESGLGARLAAGKCFKNSRDSCLRPWFGHLGFCVLVKLEARCFRMRGLLESGFWGLGIAFKDHSLKGSTYPNREYVCSLHYESMLWFGYLDP